MSSPVLERRASALGFPVLLISLALSLGSAAALVAGRSAAEWALWASTALVLAVVVAGVCWQASGVFARPLLSVRTPRAEVALTFDDGPNPEHTLAILDALEARGHRGTFFVIGERAERHPEILAAVVARGHALANHSFSHGPFTNALAPRRLAEELERTNALLAKAGADSRFFRAPVGLLSPRIARAVVLAKMDLVGWTASARDGVAWRTVEEGAARLRAHLSPGAILVLHDGRRASGRPPIALPILQQLLNDLDSCGLRSVTLEQLLRP